jgi:hypothetical protein
MIVRQNGAETALFRRTIMTSPGLMFREIH